ncbi:MAG: hypothetical protein HY537_16045 [Deltaproteobacteria bacterium]|nr:hypothetical protein [Deltaproteobacteria bacterium]
MNQRLIVLDDELSLIDAYKTILGPPPQRAVIKSSRQAAAYGITSVDPIFDVTYVSSGTEALALIEKAFKQGKGFAGGFFDVKLGPGIDGIEVIRGAMNIDADIHCTIVTAYQDRTVDELRKIFGEKQSERWDFLTKPFTRSEILQKAFNMIANWDRVQRDKQQREQMKRQQQALIQALLDETLLVIRETTESALKDNTQKGMELALKSVQTCSLQATDLLRSLLAQEKEQPKKKVA